MLSSKEFWTKKTLVGLGLGQFLSLLITSTGFSSSELARRGINVPTSQSFLNYVLLAIVYGITMILRKRALKAKWYYYVVLALVDVEANFLGGNNPLKGDLLVIAGSILYAVSNVSEEFLVKSADRVELMALLGSFGAIVSAIQISILERNELKSIRWSAGAALPFVGFSAAMFMFYSLVPVLLKLSGSAMLNLSLLTSDMWAVFIRIFAYHQKVDWMYFIAFAAVVIGLVIYSGGDKDDEQHTADVADEDAERSRHFDEEAGPRNSNRSSMAGGSRIGDSNKDDSAPKKGSH
ncbi:solute carrier family 35 member F2-like isoform X2 [Vitis riparia]|uniref:solute carrier family 35 member F2-like isoform X2 n=1 Tax=Vitis riparia TaxID=96939 RepID=UPI00155A9747|nr:solute carrier family 35 member F2-like isoform X2 [Vitis riparia]